jgi:predicted dehydrogenase
MSQLRFGLIGLGVHGSRYARHLLHDVPQARLAAVCRKNRRLGEEFARQQRVQYYADYRQLMADPQVQAVAVVTTPNHNLDICREAARAGKHILVEKPMASNAAYSQGIIDAAEAAGVKLMVAHTLRYDSVVREIIKQKDRVGELHALHLCQRAEPFALPWQDESAIAGGGAILQMGIHLFDLVRYITQTEVVRVYCEMQRVYNRHLEDGFVAILTLNSGIKAVLDCARFSGGRSGRIELIGEKGQLVGDYVKRQLQLNSNGEEYNLSLPEAAHTVERTLSAFTDCVLNDKLSPITGLDGLRGIQVAEACYASLELGQPVALKKP